MIQQTFEKPGLITLDALDVRLVAGRVNVVGTDSPARVDMTAIGRRPVVVECVDGRLSIRHERPEGMSSLMWWLGGFGRAFRVDVSVAVPNATRAFLRVVSGSVVASGLRNGVEVEVTSGRVSLLGLGGEVRVKTVSGSITCDLDNFRDSDIRLQTTSGEITARVRDDSDLDARLHAVSGRITSGFPQLPSADGAGTHSVSGRLGKGTGRLNVNAISGNISLLARPVEDDEGVPEEASVEDEGGVA